LRLIFRASHHQRGWRQRRKADDFSHEVYDAMAGCLACKSCAGQCPIKVNVPEFRAQFLALYHTRYWRPLRDYLIGSLEFSIPYFARVPGLYNAVMNAAPVKRWLADQMGMVDSPSISRFDFQAVLARWQVEPATVARLQQLSPAQISRSVVLVQDAFTRYFETPLLAAMIELAARMGY
jgi:Fe-S oxidoreductase